MAQRRSTPAVDSQAEHDFQREFDDVLEYLASEQQQPPDTERVSEPRKARLWGLRDPRVDETFKDVLMSTGFGPEDLQAMLLIQEHPDLAEVFGQPVPDPEMAEALTALAEHPFRLGTYRHILDPDERTAEAERIHRAWQRMQGIAVAEQDDDEDEGEPTMGGY